LGQVDVLYADAAEFWQKVIAINYVGVLNCTKTALD